MNCTERERLREILRIALQEMVWLYEERARIADERPSELDRFDEVLPHAKQRQQEASSNYHFHIAKHGCGRDVKVGDLLKDQLDTARAAHLAASARFDLLVKDSPSGIPHPDGTLRIQQAGQQMRAALRRYMWALNRFSEFTVSGTVPEDLQPPEDPIVRS